MTSELSASAIRLSRLEARALTDQVKRHAEELWRELVQLYEGGAHTALGYSADQLREQRARAAARREAA